MTGHPRGQSSSASALSRRGRGNKGTFCLSFKVECPLLLTDIVSQVDGFSIDDSPCGLEAMMNALAAINVRWKDFDGTTDEMFFGFARLSTGRSLWGLLVGILVAGLVAIETVILSEDGLLRRLGIHFGCQHGFQSLYSLFGFLVLFS